jgi:hypothetical protein
MLHPKFKPYSLKSQEGRHTFAERDNMVSRAHRQQLMVTPQGGLTRAHHLFAEMCLYSINIITRKPRRPAGTEMGRAICAGKSMTPRTFKM